MTTFAGTAANDTIGGSSGKDELLGFGGDDTLTGGDGDDYLDGGADKDTAAYFGLVTDYKFLYDKKTGLLTVSDSELNRDGIDTVANIEIFTFAKTTKTLADLINLVSGTPNFDQILTGTGANDLFTSGPGSDSINGAGGVDTVSYIGARANYTFARTATGLTVADRTGASGTDTLQNVERLKFFDGGLAFDTGVTQSAGATQLLLGAVLGKDLLATKKPLIGTAIDLFDQGFTMEQLSGAIMRLDIWGLLANGGQPGATNTQIANYLLTTVNKAAPDAATLAAAVNALNTETGAAQGNFLWHLAESAANQVQVGLVGLASTGLEFGG